jgi:glyoxylase-like metal-dependent hydrolase (beta-lactamase superfamily II)
MREDIEIFVRSRWWRENNAVSVFDRQSDNGGAGPQMFALTFLGTSASVPSAERNHPGLLVEAANQRILVDCGEGTQRQLLRSGIGFRRLDRLLLTHGHFDHVLGIPGLF